MPVLTLLQPHWLICYSRNSPKDSPALGSPHLLFPLLGMFFLWIPTWLFSLLSGLCTVFLLSPYLALLFSIIFIITWHVLIVYLPLLKYKLASRDWWSPAGSFKEVSCQASPHIFSFNSSRVRPGIGSSFPSDSKVAGWEPKSKQIDHEVLSQKNREKFEKGPDILKPWSIVCMCMFLCVILFV